MIMYRQILYCCVLLALLLPLKNCTPTELKDAPPTCDSKIYCQGELLHSVQIQKIFEDSKTFVDLKLTENEDIILAKFEELKQNYSGTIPNTKLLAFVNEYFIDCSEGFTCKELMPWEPKDWSEAPEFLNKIKDPDYKRWASDLNKMWKKLARIMHPQVKEDSNLTSLIYVPNGFIIPGGRFEEMYYWDTYWVIKGILISGMKETAKGIIQNFLHLMKQIGHIPNGSRVYYSHRTQPPLLISMVEAYVQETGDKSLIKDSLELLNQEMEYYVSNRVVNVAKDNVTYEMYRYYAVSAGPRPESYREDYEHSLSKKTDSEKMKFYVAMKSGAESGWDFSSRWFVSDRGNQGSILDMNTQEIIPVDLNSFLHKNFKLLAGWNKEYGSRGQARYFRRLEKKLLTAMNNVLWHEQDGIWYDYDNLNQKPRKYFYMSNFAPIWTQSHSFDKKNLTESILRYQSSLGLSKYLGGKPTSLTFSSEQWDTPDAWPPLQTYLIQGLDSLGTSVSQEAAYNFASQWIASNFAGYKKYGKMFEKYDALNPGEPGSGGEYQDQDGFGWTNGIALELLTRYGDVLESSTIDQHTVEDLSS